MTRHITATQARKQFFMLLNLAGKPGHAVTISLEGKPNVVMMSQEEFEGWMETLEIMSDKKLMQNIRKGTREMRQKKGIPLERVLRDLEV